MNQLLSQLEPGSVWFGLVAAVLSIGFARPGRKNNLAAHSNLELAMQAILKGFP